MLFKKHSNEPGAVDDQGVATGQRYRSAGAKAILWEVSAVLRYPWEPSPHVRLQRVGTPGDLKTIGLETLLDPRYFQPDK
jgi:hypothetical protein